MNSREPCLNYPPQHFWNPLTKVHYKKTKGFYNWIKHEIKKGSIHLIPIKTQIYWLSFTVKPLQTKDEGQVTIIEIIVCIL